MSLVIVLQQWTIAPEDAELAANIMARLACSLDPEIVEWEAADIIQEWLVQGTLNMVNVNDLVMMLKSTRFDAEKDLLN